ncbi:hypothetical protein GV791_20255 [Nocardia cyriacigeorgica]|uniref:ADP ribosyltransferase domain-containing protein n=1 Tax=Nocardia cyriacigeorgica TaxID=135487 RepID=A0A6P1CT83_9NOCA|nr:ADP-ribosyltransferase [Nocardia cyriacigeorgica]NEW34873.1 hypothetical protein [Nocardia cyriacigeorgica]
MFGGSPANELPSDNARHAPMRRFLSNSAGHEYGEQALGRTRDSLPRSQFGELYRYTVNSWINEFLRHDDPSRHLDYLAREDAIYRPLRPLIRDLQITPDLLRHLSHRNDLTPEQRRAMHAVMSDRNPLRRMSELRHNADFYYGMEQTFGTTPTMRVLEAHTRELDRALTRPLPERVEAIRGLRTVEFMTVDDLGTELGAAGSPHDLVGTIQTERSYISSSLGATPPPHFNHQYRLELDVPAGIPGIWMGARSRFPDQRELVLPRGLRYRIVEVVENPQDARYAGVKYVLRAVVIPPGAAE